MPEDKQQSQTKNTGRWSQEEHERFMYAMMQYGKDWKKVQDYVRTRTGSQVRSHAQKFFNKLQKPNKEHQEHPNRPAEFSETEFDHSRQINNEATPIELLSLIKRQQKEQGGKINLENLKKTLEDHHNEQEKEVNNIPEGLQRAKSFKSMSNILSAYEEVNQEMQNEDESFFILLTKKYKKYFNQMHDFDKLIDLHQPVREALEHAENSSRKRSFTLPEGSELSEDELEQRIEEIKKKIKVDSNNNTTVKTSDKKQVQPLIIKSQIKEIQPTLTVTPKDVKLSTIAQSARQQEEVASNKILPCPLPNQKPSSVNN